MITMLAAISIKANTPKLPLREPPQPPVLSVVFSLETVGAVLVFTVLELVETTEETSSFELEASLDTTLLIVSELISLEVISLEISLDVSLNTSLDT